MVLPRAVDGEREVAQADRRLRRALDLNDVEDDPRLVGAIGVIGDRASGGDRGVLGDQGVDGRLAGDRVEDAAAQVESRNALQ